MGNWRTVSIHGRIDPKEVSELRRNLTIDIYGPDPDWDNWGPLTIHRSLAGLGDWVGAEVNAGGNLAERDYDVEDVAEHLRKVVAFAPSAELKVHCGDEWESTTCIATITVANGAVEVGPPEIAEVSGVSGAESALRLLGFLGQR